MWSERRVLLIVGVMTIVCMCVALLIRFSQEDRNHSEAESPRVAMNSAPTKLDEIELPESTSSPTVVSTTRSHTELETLRTACPDIRVETSDGCFSALDEYFMDSPLPMFGSVRDRLLHVESQLTFRRIFADPFTDRENSITALKNEKCRLERGAIHPELKTECHATAIANHALFNNYCGYFFGATFQSDWFEPMHPIKGITFYQRELNQLESLHWENLDDYHASIGELDEDMYREAWLYQKCTRFGSEVRQPLHNWPSIIQSNEKYVSKYYADGTMHWSQKAREYFLIGVLSDEYERLLAIAARLGDEWAMVTHYHRGAADDEFRNSVEELRPWFPALKETVSLNGPLVKLLLKAVESVLLAEQEGVAIDKELMARMTCRTREYAMDCGSAFDVLSQMQLSSRAQQIVDELRRITAELEPKSKCFDENGEERYCGRGIYTEVYIP